jgi:hypothetical protein
MRSIACRASHRSFATTSLVTAQKKEFAGALQPRGGNTGLKRRWGYEVYIAFEQVFQALLQFEIGIGVEAGWQVYELHQHIQIAA